MFFGNVQPTELVRQYGSPLYVYNEETLRRRCREIRNLLTYPRFVVNYSAKANSNLELLKILHQEGVQVDAMSPGEIQVELAAGFAADEILYIGNNVSAAEMEYAIKRGVLVSVDSLSQLEMYGQLNPGGRVAVRFNPGMGAGHHEKVVTAGQKTKFGVEDKQVTAVQELAKQYQLVIVGINQHIGSLFLDGAVYLEAARALLTIAGRFPTLEFVDFGGGFGIPYQRDSGETRLDLESLGRRMDALLTDWAATREHPITFKVEPGRYLVAECGVLLGSVHSIKENYGVKYVGTDLGFNVLMRPILYDSYHEVEVYPADGETRTLRETVTVVGNICETGDIIARGRELPEIRRGDVLGVLDAGAYGYVMSSNYNNRLRPAEVLLTADGSHRLIRRRETMEDLIRTFTL
ncbi:MAG TPA: diaminopimelate decarboxylase [Patescibacteria group bacterium]|nr:diaminopimelate decarboxylase [Patescibacteria group bacterium]